MKFITASSLAGLILLTALLSGKAEIRYAGVNLAGAEFGESNFGTNYGAEIPGSDTIITVPMPASGPAAHFIRIRARLGP